MLVDLDAQNSQVLIQLLDRCNRSGAFSLGEVGVVYRHVTVLQQAIEQNAQAELRKQIADEIAVTEKQE